jgi:hypothetical protein
MLYSQINYIGCFLPLPEQIKQQIESLIANFVNGNLRLSRERIFLKSELGGLGLFDLDSFLNAQRCSWVKRAMKIDQIWKLRLFKDIGTGIRCLSEQVFNQDETPSTYCKAKAFTNFIHRFTEQNNNFLKSYLFNNKAMISGTRQKKFLDSECLDPALLGPEQANDGVFIRKIKNIKYSDLYAAGNFKNKRELQLELNYNLPDYLWTLLLVDKIRRTAIS